jgi:hypothetical protein
MHFLINILLQTALLVCCGLLAKALRFAAGCWKAHRQLVNSPIPGPKPASMVIGEQYLWLLFLYFTRLSSLPCNYMAVIKKAAQHYAAVFAKTRGC